MATGDAPSDNLRHTGRRLGRPPRPEPRELVCQFVGVTSYRDWFRRGVEFARQKRLAARTTDLVEIAVAEFLGRNGFGEKQPRR
jgi:hypothetical protein